LQAAWQASLNFTDERAVIVFSSKILNMKGLVVCNLKGVILNLRSFISSSPVKQLGSIYHNRNVFLQSGCSKKNHAEASYFSSLSFIGVS